MIHSTITSRCPSKTLYGKNGRKSKEPVGGAERTVTGCSIAWYNTSVTKCGCLSNHASWSSFSKWQQTARVWHISLRETLKVHPFRYKYWRRRNWRVLYGSWKGTSAGHIGLNQLGLQVTLNDSQQFTVHITTNSFCVVKSNLWRCSGK
jgi:hypothetical protein